MLRDPAIHIKRSDLLKICKEEGVIFPKEFVDQLMLKSSKITLHNRVLITTKARTAAKVARTTVTQDGIVPQFNRVYNSVLTEHHIKATFIHKGSKLYLTMKEVATNAYNFREEFNISVEEGFKYYVNLGIQVLGKNFSIYRLKSADNKIRIRYTNLMLVFNDSDPQGTARMADAWHVSLKEFHGLEMKINEDQYAALVLTRQEADKAKAKYIDWITAQFDKWTFMNSMPEFSQLYGDNAALAYTKYMINKKAEFKNEDERKHFETIKHEKEIPLKETKRNRG